MNGIIEDMKFGIRAFRISREARANAKREVAIPIMPFDGWTWTPEACLFYHKGDFEDIECVFDSFDEKTRKKLAFAPESTREHIDRIRMWQEALRDPLPPKRYHEVMLRLTEWAVRCSKQTTDM